MSGDYSRLSSRRWPIYDGTLLQQGRPLTDRDWNDLVAQFNRRNQAGTLDTSGQLLTSTAVPNPFEIDFVSGDLVINRGRIYVDGLLADNRGAGDLQWDPMLTEQFGKDRVPYTQQKYFPNAPALPTSGGPYLVLLDVWQREVTQLEDKDIVETALGVDSTTRLQTVWQVKVLPGGGASVTCGSPLGFKSSSGRLTTSTGVVPGDVDPCLVPPSGGYKGLENQLYRVEIHKKGPLGTATFKWSRDNASVKTRVTKLIDLSHIVVEDVGKDNVLRFSDGDWIEITDNWLELNGQAGILRKIKVGGGVDDATRTITLDAALPAGQFPTNSEGKPDPDRHTRIRRWDQKGKVFDESGAVFTDLDAAGSDGSILVPLTAGKKLLLEDGVLVAFSIDSDTTVGDGEFHVSDYWAFYARVNDASIEILDQEPPRGIHHHYANLALFTPPSAVTMCFPKPEAEQGDCCCTVVVAPGEGVTEDIQKAIDSLPKEGGCVCLKPGVHRIAKPITITQDNVKLVGESLGAIVQMEAPDAALSIGDVERIEISTIEFSRPKIEDASPIVAFLKTARSTMEGCVVKGASPQNSIGVSIDAARQVRIAYCWVQSVSTGIYVTNQPPPELAWKLPVLSVEGNVIDLTNQEGSEPAQYGIYLHGVVSPVHIKRNLIRGALSGIIVNDEVSDSKPHSYGMSVTQNFVICAKAPVNKPVPMATYGISVLADDSIVSQNVVMAVGHSSSIPTGIGAFGTRMNVCDNDVIGDIHLPLNDPIGISIGQWSRPTEVVRASGNFVTGYPLGIAAAHVTDIIVAGNIIHAISAEGFLTSGGMALVGIQDGHIHDNEVEGGSVGVTCILGIANRIATNTLKNAGGGVLVMFEIVPTIAANRITTMKMFGIAVVAVLGRCDVVGNRLFFCGFAPPGPGYGIGAYWIDGDWNVESNEVSDTGLSPGGASSPGAVYGITGLLVRETRIDSNLVTYSFSYPNFFPTSRPTSGEDRALLITGLADVAHTWNPELITSIGHPIQILGNKFIGPGRRALVELYGLLVSELIPDRLTTRFERVMFSNNVCLHVVDAASQTGGTDATVILAGKVATVMGNQIKTLTTQGQSVPKFPSVNFGAMSGPFIGNVTSGPVVNQTQEFPTPTNSFNTLMA